MPGVARRQASAALDGARARTPARRIEGVDAARSLAFAGMALAHFVHPVRDDDPGWLQAVAKVADGRAAPLFCVLLGVGAGILIDRGASDHALVRRGAALFVLGYAIWPVVDRVVLILPHYGLLLAATPWLRRIPTRWLLPAAAGAFLVPSIVTAVVEEHGLLSAEQPDRYLDLLNWLGLLWQILWSGAYPALGWCGFVLVGLWVARQPLRSAATQWRLVLVGAVLAGLQPLAAAAFDALDGTRRAPDAGGWSAFFDGTSHSQRTAWFVIATASAVAVIGLCLVAARHAKAVVAPVALLGRHALTVYLAHLLVGAWLVWDWRDESEPPLAAQLAVWAVVVAGFGVLSHLWARRFRRGPLEAVLRAIAA